MPKKIFSTLNFSHKTLFTMYLCWVIHFLIIYSIFLPHLLQKKHDICLAEFFSTSFWKKYITLILTLLEWVWQQTRPIFTLNGWDEGHKSTIKRWVLQILNHLVFWLHIYLFFLFLFILISDYYYAYLHCVVHLKSWLEKCHNFGPKLISQPQISKNKYLLFQK